MRLLVVLDANDYSTQALDQAARLAGNTWAGVVLLCVFPEKIEPLQPEIKAIADRYTERFLNSVGSGPTPYSADGPGTGFQNTDPGVYEKTVTSAKTAKELVIRLRGGHPGRIILDEAGKDEYDLIVLGCETHRQCRWEAGGNIPYKTAMEAPCSVLVVKKETDTGKVLGCLDHDRISQNSLEMICQMSTLFSADLDIVGLTKKFTLKEAVQEKLDRLSGYYLSNGIQPWIEIVDMSAMDQYISQANRWSLIAMWMGNQSIFEQLLPGGKVATLLQKSESSVLLLR